MGHTFVNIPSSPVDIIWLMMIVWRIRRKYYQNCSVLCCVRHLCTMICTHVWAVLTVNCWFSFTLCQRLWINSNICWVTSTSFRASWLLSVSWHWVQRSLTTDRSRSHWPSFACHWPSLSWSSLASMSLSSLLTSSSFLDCITHQHKPQHSQLPSQFYRIPYTALYSQTPI